MTRQMHVNLFLMVLMIVGGSLFFLHINRPLASINILLLGIFLILVQILVALYRKQ